MHEHGINEAISDSRRYIGLTGLAHRGQFLQPNQSDSTRPVPSLKNIPLPVSPKSAP
jgi:hypothetical protein